ncbi:hypothetical protein WR25_22880 [Diploscapter pachys]|uniref:Uncharacterized protein n=1 Tax=Diploscapter pachys TaxID=2018661 RepID=A0A2A2KAC4_9BILA|nr:hypothetical protein WR25_22880 [Diploscapter pachys]
MAVSCSANGSPTAAGTIAKSLTLMTMYRPSRWKGTLTISVLLDRIDVEKYWFGFKVKGGSPIPIGPFSYSQVNLEREKAKARDAEVSVWFVADTKEEALVDQLRRQVLDGQAGTVLVELDALAEQVRLETDRHTFGATGEAAVLGEGALVRSEALGDSVVAGLDETDWRADLALLLGIGHQVTAFLARGIARQVLILHEVGEGLEQRAGLAGRVDAFLSSDEVAEVDACGEVQRACVELARWCDSQVMGYGNRIDLLQDCDRQVRLFHQPGQVLCCGSGEVDEVGFAGYEVVQPAAKRVSPGCGMEEPPAFAGLGVVGVVDIVEQVLDGAAVRQDRASQVQNRRAAVRLLVDEVHHCVANRHG